MLKLVDLVLMTALVRLSMVMVVTVTMIFGGSGCMGGRGGGAVNIIMVAVVVCR